MISISNASPAVAWHHVRKSYPDGLEALRGIDLAVAPDECLAILGTSGSGKTTLLKMVNRLIDPTSGDVLVRGVPTRDWDPIALRRSIGYVIQDVGLMPHMSILKNVGLPLRLQGRPSQERNDEAWERLELVGLDPARFATLMPHQLSGGQRQRVGVARALMGDPDLILMDEPFGALDPITRRELQDEFRRLCVQLQKAVVFVTHDIREACRVADRLAIIDHGKLMQLGTPSDLIERPANDFVRDFFRDAEAVVEVTPGASE
ncbi:ATP-binding cassette domain-containing protein [Singulisphaera acidiphila]|uniref:ABC-type proline/glycine betaine transport system, ATPase component n=1 Tax=Singulisphaera acidiphila (strain ATCC BAA-1392 / DSM 18658 / VKM B-2454 / MOB10) TaxID=886293 RepID=L0DDG3_SINAD|nr:ATP-binding cassette domain-containing protein [Singulisphaera acidiphila]AGA27302.1 ABC-type proline/glycine betaine transport system, ATPase component [Singulisphaera acidiphila DSM 18658]